jgi:hypothetical protein
MANLHNVGDNVVCQKLGGQSGTKVISPPFNGKVLEVLAGGTEYRVEMKTTGNVHSPAAHFGKSQAAGRLVKEEFMTAA